ncbi:citrate synthase/methylcitrate synthase [Mesorhizobium xinjiangense]|uniref:citrate synthase/methylcitrate synthase n=1 Tax=Mesorhizobium xinjiangense TaxID=2678685 RepID=UPI0012ED2A08|nr:citrate synthase/methylcitrate synthase [Mesorhizobium xinjiangense]
MTNGLDDVVAAETVLSDVDGAKGRLVIRGHAVEDLAAGWAFEDVVHLLLEGFVDGLPAGEDLRSAIGSARLGVFKRISPHLAALRDLEPVDALRAGLSLLADGDDLDTALQLVAAPAVITAARLRMGAAKTPVAPDPANTHSADFLRMISGRPATAHAASGLDSYLATVSDHGMNASTFTARTVASTQAGLGSAAIAGLCALKGPLHGGAPGPVLAMLDAIATPQAAHGWLAEALARGDRLMGFGHRIYRVRDPRADALKQAIARLSSDEELAGRIALAEAVETAALDLLRTAKPDRSLDTNVEFYTAALLEALGFPAQAFTCVFAAGRVVGWIAHAREQAMTGRLIRPQSRYIGPAPQIAA